MAERTADERPRAVPWGKIALRVFFLVLGLASLYFFLPLLLDLFEQAPKLEEVKWRWFFLMGLLMSDSEDPDVERSCLPCGQGTGGIHDIPSCAEIVESVLRDARETIARLGELL